MRLAQVRFSAIILLSSLLIASCVTLADRQAITSDLLDEAALIARLSSATPDPKKQLISLDIALPPTMQVVIKFENTDAYEAKYQYSPAVKTAAAQGLAQIYEIVPPSQGVPHVRLLFDTVDAKGSCSGLAGGFSDCAQSVAFKASLSFSKAAGQNRTLRVVGRGNAQDEDFFMPISSVDPLHRVAAKEAFTDLITDIVVQIEEQVF